MLCKNKAALVNAVKDNLNFLSSHKQKKVKMVRKVHHAVGMPTTQDLKAVTQMNLTKIINFPLLISIWLSRHFVQTLGVSKENMQEMRKVQKNNFQQV